MKYCNPSSVIHGMNTAQFDEYLAHIGSSQCDFLYSDIEYHDKHDRRVRVWNAGRFSMFKLRTGSMPPHTSVVVAKRIYRDFGVYNPEFGTAAGYECRGRQCDVT